MHHFSRIASFRFSWVILLLSACLTGPQAPVPLNSLGDHASRLHAQSSLSTMDTDHCESSLVSADRTKGNHTVTVFLAGDSTVTDHENPPYSAWGQMLPAFFGPGVTVSNHAHSGESLSSFLQSGRLETILTRIRPGDYLFLQFGHNDQKEGPSHAPAFGLYQELLRHYIREVRLRDARPVLVTSMHRRRFDGDGRIVNTLADYPEAMRQVASEQKVPLLDLHSMSRTLFESMGPKDSKQAFLHLPAHSYPEQEEAIRDDSHFSEYGAWLLAVTLAERFRLQLPELAAHLRPTIPNSPNPAAPQAADLARTAASSAPETDRPRLVLIGDSTVKVGTPGQRGWGEEIGAFFDPERLEVLNRAIGGRSSRTFLTEGRWDQVLSELRPGDFVLIQFGHNDGGPINDDFRARGTLRGTGEESEDIVNLITGREETVHTYGWYLRRYVRDTRAAGATPIVCSPIPRKIWLEDGTLARASDDYGKWARQVAENSGAFFVNLNEIIALGYEELGPEAVEAYFADERTHTNEAGARYNAQAVVNGLKQLPGRPLERFLRPAATP